MSEPEVEGPSLAGASALIFVAQIVASAGYFVAVTIVAQTLGVAGRGAVAFVTVSTILVASVSDLGAGPAAAALVPKRYDVRARLLTNGALLVSASSLAFGAIYFGLVAGLGLGPDDIDPRILLLCVPAGMFLILMHVGTWFLLGAGRPVQYAVIRAVMPWLYPVGLAVAWVAADLTINRTLFVWIVSTVLAGAITMVVAGRNLGLGRPSLTLLRESVPFGLRTWVGSLANTLNFRTDQVLMGFLTTNVALGLYAVAVNVSEILLYAPMIVSQVLIPQIARTDPASRDDAVARVFRLTALVSVAASAVFAVVCPIAIPAWFGPDFRDSVTPFLLLLPGIVGFVGLNVFSSALVGSSRPGRSSLGPGVALVVGIALDLMLIRPYGASGAAVAASAAFLVGGLVSLLAYSTPARVSIVTNAGSVVSVSLSKPFAGSLIPRRGDTGEIVQIVKRLSTSLRSLRR